MCASSYTNPLGPRVKKDRLEGPNCVLRSLRTNHRKYLKVDHSLPIISLKKRKKDLAKMGNIGYFILIILIYLSLTPLMERKSKWPGHSIILLSLSISKNLLKDGL